MGDNDLVQESQELTIQSTTVPQTQASVVTASRDSTRTPEVSVRPGTCVWTLTGNGVFSVLTGPSSTRRCSPVCGGLILTAPQPSHSTASMMTSTLRHPAKALPAVRCSLVGVEVSRDHRVEDRVKPGQQPEDRVVVMFSSHDHQEEQVAGDSKEEDQGDLKEAAGGDLRYSPYKID